MSDRRSRRLGPLRSVLLVVAASLAALAPVAGGGADKPADGGGGAIGPKGPGGEWRQPPERTIVIVGDIRHATPAAESEAWNAVNFLSLGDKFSIVLTGDGGKPQVFPTDSPAVWAGTSARKAALQFLEGSKPAARGDPLAALDVAFKSEPDILLLLTDHDFADGPAVAKRVKELNARRGAKVHTVSVVPKGAAGPGPATVKLLEAIAAENGGERIKPKEAERIVILCDVRHAMPAVAEQMWRAVDGLAPFKFFNVVLTGDGGKPQAFLPDGRLVAATRANKAAARRFFDGAKPAARGDPLAVLGVAFKDKPDLVYLLTDHDFTDGPAVAKWVTELNAGKKTRVITLAFVPKGAAGPGEATVKLLQTIAAENGGQMRKVAEAELEDDDDKGAPATKPATRPAAGGPRGG